MPACLASIFELPELPWIELSAKAQSAAVERIARHHHHKSFFSYNSEPFRPVGYAIGTGWSPRGRLHSCVFRDGQLVHDPHPSRAGIAGVDYWYFFQPLD